MILKQLKYIGLTVMAICLTLITVMWVSENHMPSSYKTVQGEVSNGAQVALLKQKNEAKHAASWAAKALFSFILPNNH